MRRRTAVGQAWASQPDPLLALARQELEFYAGACDRARWLHYTTELGALAATSATVVAAGLHAPAWLTALIAGSAVFFTGMRQLFSPGSRWVLAAQARETLRRAIDHYLLLPQSDRDADARAALHRAIDEVGTSELRGWTEVQGQRGEPPLPTGGA
ncbi:DUF4231 domain-containing protein [Streptomyces sp. NPDC101455]|uniref:DUF4231 domain-containing protein n=1 Tax=unclassified Streptomyces TaxID=2593676 RepID=UPI0037F2C133